MEVSIIQIGNSKGIRLSKAIIERYNLSDKLRVILEKGQIVLKPVDQPRKGWDEAFKRMAENGDDGALLPEIFDDDPDQQW